jgi:hypothetical protein
MLSGCNRPIPVQARLLSKSELTPAEKKFGRAPKRDRSVTYQSDVILLENGPEAIRSLGSDGFTWTIDAHAQHASEIVLGKIAFVTERCIGRVLWEKREGDNLELVLGPVELTDIFRQLDVSVNQPVDLTQALEYPAPQGPGTEDPQLDDLGPAAGWPRMPGIVGKTGPADATDGAMLVPASFAQGAPPAPGILPYKIPMTLHTRPLINSDGLGMELRREGGNIRMITQMQIRLDRPTLEFHIRIDNGKVDARAVLHNAAGLRIAFDAAAGGEFATNFDWHGFGGQLSIPIAGAPVLSVDVRQEIWVRTAFASKQSAFGAGGDYGLNADLGLAVHGTTFQLIGPKGFTVRKSLMRDMTNVSLAPNGIVLSHGVTITAGLGAAGFTVGPTVEFATSVGLAMGATEAIVQCRGATLIMSMRGGFGWTIPRPVAAFANFFLSVINVRVADHGGPKTDWQRLFAQQAQTESKVCGEPAAGSNQASGAAPHVSSSEGSGGGMLGFGPGESSASKGQTFSVEVTAEGGSGNGGAVPAQVQYDPAKLQVVKVSAGSPTKPNPAMLVERHNASSGIMRVVADRPGASGGQNTVFTITFLATSEGPARISVASADLRGTSDAQLRSGAQTVINIKSGKP